MDAKEEQKKTERLIAVVLKQIAEIKAAFKGMIIDIPVEAFLPEGKEIIL